MLNLFEETFLREYFLHNAVLGTYCARKQQFQYFAKMFDVPASRADELYLLTEQESVREIVTAADANRYNRISQYLREEGRDSLYNPLTDALISIKSEEISAATQESLCLTSNSTKSKIHQVLSDSAESGNVEAMRILGILQLSGVFVDKNCQSGKEYLVRAAQWGDVLSMFYLIKLGEKNSQLIRNFCVATDNTPYSFLRSAVQQECSAESTHGNAEVSLLNKMFNQKLVNRNVYSPIHAHVLYATGISWEEKERILLSEDKQLLSNVVGLPIYAPDSQLHCDAEALKTMPLRRDSEQNQIITALQNRDLRAWSHYKPLCLTTNSPYMQKIYAEALEKCFSGEKVARIYVEELQERDFEPTTNNVFVRSCGLARNTKCAVRFKNTTKVVYLLFLNGDISEWALKRVQDFLFTVRRRQIRLNRPDVTLDFSQALPICICDGENAAKLKKAVETVQIADADSSETNLLIDGLLKEKSQFYFGKDVKIAEDPSPLFAGFALEAIIEIIDTAFRALRAEVGDSNKAVSIRPFVDRYQQLYRERGYGFGGFYNEMH